MVIIGKEWMSLTEGARRSALELMKDDTDKKWGRKKA